MRRLERKLAVAPGNFGAVEEVRRGSFEVPPRTSVRQLLHQLLTVLDNATVNPSPITEFALHAFLDTVEDAKHGFLRTNSSFSRQVLLPTFYDQDLSEDYTRVKFCFAYH